MGNKFRTGNIVTTSGILFAMRNSALFDRFVKDCLPRYLSMDFGDLCEEDKETNANALKYNERIFAKYDIPEEITKQIEAHDKAIYIITERDRSVTTILFPSEY